MRLDLRLVRDHPGLARRRAQAAIEKGQVRVDGTTCREPGQAVADTARVDWDPNRPAEPRPFASPFPVLYRDEHLIVIDKPAGVLAVPAHPGAGDEGDALSLLLESQKRRFPRRKPFVGRVHRLDRDTSGALVFALDPAARAGLIALFRDHRIERRYLALVEGEVRNDQGKVEAAISEEWDKGRRRLARPGEAASPAVTRYRVRERFPRAALLEVELETGRQHQIRLHLAHLGLPILGERIYRGPGRSTVRSAAPPVAAPRQMLHAEILGFAHPVSGREVRVTSPLPADFLAVLGVLRRRHSPRAR